MPKALISQIRLFASRCRQDEISVYAAQAAFFLMLSVFPFFLLLFSLLRFLPDFSAADLLLTLSRLIPKELCPLVSSVFSDLYHSASPAVCSIHAFAALWSASRGTLGIERGFKRLLENTVPSGFLTRRLRHTLYTLALLFLCLFSFLLLVFGSFLQKIILRLFFLSPFLNPWISVLRFFFSFFSLTLAFTLLYQSVFRLYSAKQHTRSRSLPGAFLVSAGWLSSSFLFSFYFRISSSFSLLYGQLTLIVLFMLWLYFCLWCLFLGAELNLFLKNCRFCLPKQRSVRYSKTMSGKYKH